MSITIESNAIIATAENKKSALDLSQKEISVYATFSDTLLAIGLRTGLDSVYRIHIFSASNSTQAIAAVKQIETWMLRSQAAQIDPNDPLPYQQLMQQIAGK